jgi:hypothetical protein
MLTFRPSRRPRQNNTAAFQKVLSSTASKTSINAVSGVVMQEEAISDMPNTRV